MLKLNMVVMLFLKIVSMNLAALRIDILHQNWVTCGILISPGKVLDLPDLLHPAEIYKRGRSIYFNPMALMRVQYGNLGKRSLNAALQDMGSSEPVCGMFVVGRVRRRILNPK